MPSSTMRTAVLQATAFYVLASLVDYHMAENMFDQVVNNEGWLNMTSALDQSAPYLQSPNASGRLTLDAGNSTNTSLSLSHIPGLNGTAVNGTLGATGKVAESFYGRRLPRDTVVCMVICALQYYWLIWLERMFPARPRYKAVLREEKVEESEDREEEVVKKWIAQGRVHRASLNWCNTFLKWVLEMTVGKVMYNTVGHILSHLLKFNSPRTALKGLKSHVAYNIIGAYISLTPLATLIAFIVMPAHKQIVFIAGADLVLTIFVTTLFRAFATWAIKTKFAQKMMQKITEHARKMETDQEYIMKFQNMNNEYKEKKGEL